MNRRIIGVVDQIVSSLTNVACAVMAARSLGARELGTFSIVASVVLVSIGVSRVFSSDPLVLTQSARPHAEQRVAARSALHMSLVIGLIAGVPMSGAYFALSNDPSWVVAFLLFAGSPFVMVQDCLRYLFVMQGNSHRALAIDCAWFLLLMVGWSLTKASSTTAGGLLLLWLASGAIAGLPAIPTLTPFRLRLTSGWVTEHRALIAPQLGQFAVGLSTGLLLIPLVAILSGVTAAGTMRVAQIAASPYNVLAQGLNMVTLPTLVRKRAHGMRSLRRACLQLSIALAAFAVANAIAVAVIPDSLGIALFGDSWTAARATAVLLSAQSIPVALGAGAVAGVLANRWVLASFKLKSLVSLFTLALCVVGAQAQGAFGTAIGLLVAASVAAPMWWRLLMRRSNSDALGDVDDASAASSL